VDNDDVSLADQASNLATGGSLTRDSGRRQLGGVVSSYDRAALAIARVLVRA